MSQNNGSNGSILDRLQCTLTQFGWNFPNEGKSLKSPEVSLFSFGFISLKGFRERFGKTAHFISTCGSHVMIGGYRMHSMVARDMARINGQMMTSRIGTLPIAMQINS